MLHVRATSYASELPLSRRDLLRLGTLASLTAAGTKEALHAPRSAAAATAAGDAPARAGFGRAKSVILVFTSGGQSQLDMWDPKPTAPLDVRGAFAPIATNVAGVQVCEHLPRVAQTLDRCTLVRSMSHEDLDHGSAVYLALTGHYHPRRSSNPPPSNSDFPTLGALVRRLRPRPKFVSDAIHLNGPALVPTTVSPGQQGGLLGRGYEPWVIGDVRDPRGAMPGLAPHTDWPTARIDERLGLKRSFDALQRELDERQAARDLAGWYTQAQALLANPAARAAFDLQSEPATVRDRYGRHRSGQAMLLARRLVEAGVPFINVIWNHSNRGQDLDELDTDVYGWDTHNDIFQALRERLLPRFDESFAALLEDLDARGLLDQTLVVCMGEFGRAPRVALEPRFAGATPGRKHWSNVYSIVCAGAGVQRGAVVGASDRLGGEPITARYGPWDVAATIFHALGIDPHSQYSDLEGRPLPLTHGQPITALYGSA
ncbi:MAG: DUF1501 domain-containing protein [Pirellulales bacterium]